MTTLPFLFSGVQLLKIYCANARSYSTSIPELDALIGGSLNSGQVFELIGYSQAGKTHICHAMTARVAASHPPVCGHRVLYIDCAGQFSIARLLKFAEKECRCEVEAGDIEERHVAQTMKRVSVMRCPNLEELVAYFESLISSSKSMRKSLPPLQPTQSQVNKDQLVENQMTEKQPELIVIDSLATAVSLMATPSPPDKNSKEDNPISLLLERLIAKFSLLVRQVANINNIAIVITNPIPVPQILFSGSYCNAWTSAPHIRVIIDSHPDPKAPKIQTKSNSGNEKAEILRRYAVLRHHSGYCVSVLTPVDQSRQQYASFILPT